MKLITDHLKGNKITTLASILCSLSAAFFIDSLGANMLIELMLIIGTVLVIFVCLAIWFFYVEGKSSTQEAEVSGHWTYLIGGGIVVLTLFYSLNYYYSSNTNLKDILKTPIFVHFSAFLSLGLATLKSSEFKGFSALPK